MVKSRNAPRRSFTSVIYEENQMGCFSVNGNDLQQKIVRPRVQRKRYHSKATLHSFIINSEAQKKGISKPYPSPYSWKMDKRVCVCAVHQDTGTCTTNRYPGFSDWSPLSCDETLLPSWPRPYPQSMRAHANLLMGMEMTSSSWSTDLNPTKHFGKVLEWQVFRQHESCAF